MLIFFLREKRIKFLFTFFERKENRETRIINKVFLIILFIKEGLRQSWRSHAIYQRVREEIRRLWSGIDHAGYEGKV